MTTFPRRPAVDQLDCGSGADKAHEEAQGNDDGIVPDWHILSDPLGELGVYLGRHDVNMDFGVKCWGKKGRRLSKMDANTALEGGGDRWYLMRGCCRLIAVGTCDE